MRRLRRIWCVLFGCGLDDGGYCPRCGEHVYEGWHYVEFNRAMLAPIRRWWWAMEWRCRWLLGRRCDVCKRRFWSRKREFCCSEKCYGQWIPF